MRKRTFPFPPKAVVWASSRTYLLRTTCETPWSTGVPSGLRESQALTSDADPAAAGRASVATTAQSSGRRSGNVDGSDGVVAVRQREADVDDAGPGECVAHPEFAIAGVRGCELVPRS